MARKSGKSLFRSTLLGALGWCLVAGCSGRAELGASHEGDGGVAGAPEDARQGVAPRNGWDPLFRTFRCSGCQGVSIAPRAGGGFVLEGSFDDTVGFEGMALFAQLGSHFVAAFDGEAHVVWVRQETASVSALAPAPDGSVYMALANWGMSPDAGSTNSMSLVKVDAQGQTVWTKDFQASPVGGIGTVDVTMGLAVDRDRSIVATGYFTGTIDFGGGPLTSTPDAPSFPYPDVFLARFDENGQHLSSRRYGESGYQHGQSIAISESGQIAIAGVGALEAADIDVPDSWFLMITDRQGQPTHSRTFSHARINGRLHVRWAGDGVVVGGGFGTELDIGLGPTMSATTENVFVARFDAAGTPSWNRAFGSDYHNVLAALSTDTKGRALISGHTIGFNQPMSLAGTTVGSGTWETFVGMFDERGAPLWAKGILRNDDGARVAPLASTVDETGAIYFAGVSSSLSGIYVGKLVP
jgi:hypothetical protein